MPSMGTGPQGIPSTNGIRTVGVKAIVLGGQGMDEPPVPRYILPMGPRMVGFTTSRMRLRVDSSSRIQNGAVSGSYRTGAVGIIHLITV